MNVVSALTDEQIFAAAAKLPTAPRVLVKLGQLINDPNVDSEQVVALLRQDPGMVAPIIRMANSAAFSPPEPIGFLERAISFVGFTEVHRLVGVIAASQMAEQGYRWYTVTPSQLRLHTLFVALIMEEMARWADEKPSSCYTMGLLRPVGVMVLDQVAPCASGGATFAESGKELLDEWEREQWETTNPEVAEKVLKHWRMPHETVQAIRHHYRPIGRHSPVIHLLHLATLAASDQVQGIDGEKGYWSASEDSFAKSGLDPKDFGPVVSRACRNLDRLKLAIT
jgi:HD-like signal output (HDOD) protein